MIALGENVFLNPVIEDQVGLILKARMSRTMPSMGIITAISDVAAKKYEVKIGYKVVFDPHHQQLDEDEKSTTIKAEHILAVVT